MLWQFQKSKQAICCRYLTEEEKLEILCLHKYSKPFALEVPGYKKNTKVTVIVWLLFDYNLT